MADETSSSPADETSVTFHVKASSEAKYTITVSRSITVRELKEKLAGSEYSNTPADRQRLIYSGRVLKDPDQLETYKIKEGNTVHLVRSAASNQAPGGGGVGSSSTAGSSSTGGNAASTVPSNLATGPGNNPLAGLTGARYAGLAQLPGASMFGPDGGMGAPPDAEGMASMLNDPQFASTLNEALANPAVLDMIIEQNPALREMGPLARQMMRTEEFRRMLTDPNALRQMSQVSRSMRMGLGGMGLGGGGVGGSGGFPAPGMTDTTPADAAGSHPTPNPTNPTMTGAGNMGGLPIDQNLLNLLTAGLQHPSGNSPVNPNIFAPLFGQPGSSTAPSTGSGGAAAGASGGNNTGQTPPVQQQTGAGTSPFGIDPSQATNDQMRQFYAALTAAGSGSSNDITNPPPTGPAGGNLDPGAPFASLLPMLSQLMMNQPGGGGGGSPGAINPFQPPSTGGSPAPPADTRPPEERYESQLRQLNDMGFFDFDRNVEALRRSGGSVNGAVEYLLTH
ncbi:MAG: hypothetical protein M1823_001403 [Watsoniomyces obsoletus]|nr:MAG: hypothetical protein M1823_001403 [Watsoniomyces obsoletus]